jgi:hypothetical protein
MSELASRTDGVRGDKACSTRSTGNDEGDVTRLPPLWRDFLRSSRAVQRGNMPTGCARFKLFILLTCNWKQTN